VVHRRLLPRRNLRRLSCQEVRDFSLDGGHGLDCFRPTSAPKSAPPHTPKTPHLQPEETHDDQKKHSSSYQRQTIPTLQPKPLRPANPERGERFGALTKNRPALPVSQILCQLCPHTQLTIQSSPVDAFKCPTHLAIAARAHWLPCSVERYLVVPK
jgi:hypothetical protein